MRRTGDWHRRRKDLRGSRHSILVTLFVSAKFLVVQVANRWQLWSMTSQYTESHGSIWLDRDAFFTASGMRHTFCLRDPWWSIEVFMIECTSDGSREAGWRTKL